MLINVILLYYRYRYYRLNMFYILHYDYYDDDDSNNVF